MEAKEKFEKYLNEGIELFNQGNYGRSIDIFSAANYVDQNQTPYYWMAKARYKEGDVWRALYNFYLGLCHFKDMDGLISRAEMHRAIKAIEPELAESAPQYIDTWNELKNDSRFY